jgi:hypothetical protein
MLNNTVKLILYLHVYLAIELFRSSLKWSIYTFAVAGCKTHATPLTSLFICIYVIAMLFNFNFNFNFIQLYFLYFCKCSTCLCICIFIAKFVVSFQTFITLVYLSSPIISFYTSCLFSTRGILFSLHRLYIDEHITPSMIIDICISICIPICILLILFPIYNSFPETQYSYRYSFYIYLAIHYFLHKQKKVYEKALVNSSLSCTLFVSIFDTHD